MRNSEKSAKGPEADLLVFINFHELVSIDAPIRVSHANKSKTFV